MTKAEGSAADALILDLEDSVAPAKKAEARRSVRDFAQGRPLPLWLRINPVGSPDWESDLEIAIEADLAGVVVPKAAGGSTLLRIDGWLNDHGAVNSLGILPIATETPASLFNLGGYVDVTPRLRALTWGAEDLSAAVGASTAREPDGSYTPLYALARSLCLAGACAAGVPPIETVYPDFRDVEGLQAYAARGRRDGFAGMMAIHPAQAPILNDAFSPTEAELVFARRVVELFASRPDAGTLSLDGRMLDAPHLAQARRMLERARERAETPGD
jgi:citrate lyase subunit beta/citryl-CoA lyase